jgi:hypothetical protein
MRQILLVLTSIIAKSQSPRAFELRRRAVTAFLEIICGRQDRIKVKPALQGLAHFLLRDLVSITELVEHLRQILERSLNIRAAPVSAQTLFRAFLAWVVHHDTCLSAGHLIKNFLGQARKSTEYWIVAQDGSNVPLWIEPVVRTLHEWPDRMQEFKTHVFPHCFLPEIAEYVRFLSYLHFSEHVQIHSALPEVLCASEQRETGLGQSEGFRILLAAVEAGKELTIIRDSGAYSSK